MKRGETQDPEREKAAADPLRRAPGAAPERGRGATFNPHNRFRREGREAYDDGWSPPAGDSAPEDEPAPLCARRSPSSRRGPSSRTMRRPTSRSTSPSTRTRAASTAASTAMRGPRMPITTCRRAWTSRRSSSPSPMRRAAARGAREARLSLRPHRAGHQHRSVPADRTRVEGHAWHPRSPVRTRASVHDRDQVGAGRARPGPDRADGREEHGARLHLDHHAGPRSRALARTPRGGAAAAAAGGQGT